MSVYSLGILYVHIPKTGGSSVSEWLIKNTPVSKHFKMNHPNIKTLNEECPKIDFSFTVVRNPWARAVSFYTYHKRRFESGISNVKGYTEFPSFNDFIFNYLDANINNSNYSVNNKIVDLHYWFKMSTPQVDWLDDSIDLIMRTETLQSDFKQIQEMFSCNSDLSIIRQSSSIDYKTFYDTNTKRKVEAFYQKDIDHFKYTF